MGENLPVFDPQKCPVPFVQRIPPLDIIQNCNVPQAPDPIQDCPDFNVDLPGPRAGGPPCPQIQQDEENSGFMEDIPGFPPPAILLTFELDEPDVDGGEADEQTEDNPCKFQVQLQLPCAQFIDSMMDCQLTPDSCLLAADIVPVTDPAGTPKVKQRCQFQLQVQLQIPCPKTVGLFSFECAPDGPCDGKMEVTNHIIGDTKANQFCQAQIQLDLRIQSSSKTAIVPAGNEYVGLFCHEMPESWFSDIMRVRMNGAQTEVPIDPTFMQVVDAQSLVVTSAVPETPMTIGAYVERGQVILRTDVPLYDVNTTLVIAGIRRDAEHPRFARFTEAEKIANDQFWSRAHRPE
jgi:hypothetical protein